MRLNLRTSVQSPTSPVFGFFTDSHRITSACFSSDQDSGTRFGTQYLTLKYSVQSSFHTSWNAAPGFDLKLSRNCPELLSWFLLISIANVLYSNVFPTLVSVSLDICFF